MGYYIGKSTVSFASDKLVLQLPINNAVFKQPFGPYQVTNIAPTAPTFWLNRICEFYSGDIFAPGLIQIPGGAYTPYEIIIDDFYGLLGQPSILPNYEYLYWDKDIMGGWNDVKWWGLENESFGGQTIVMKFRVVATNKSSFFNFISYPAGGQTWQEQNLAYNFNYPTQIAPFAGNPPPIAGYYNYEPQFKSRFGNSQYHLIPDLTTSEKKLFFRLHFVGVGYHGLGGGRVDTEIGTENAVIPYDTSDLTAPWITMTIRILFKANPWNPNPTQTVIADITIDGKTYPLSKNVQGCAYPGTFQYAPGSGAPHSYLPDFRSWNSSGVSAIRHDIAYLLVYNKILSNFEVAQNEFVLNKLFG